MTASLSCLVCTTDFGPLQSLNKPMIFREAREEEIDTNFVFVATYHQIWILHEAQDDLVENRSEVRFKLDRNPLSY